MSDPQRLWAIGPRKDEPVGVWVWEVVWETGTHQELLQTAEHLGYEIRGPYVLESVREEA